MTSDLDFDHVVATLDGWVGRAVRCQVLGASEVISTVEGKLEGRQESDGKDVALAVYNIGPDDRGSIWLWRGPSDRAFWVRNDQTTIGVETQGVMVSVTLDESCRSAAVLLRTKSGEAEES